MLSRYSWSVHCPRFETCWRNPLYARRVPFCACHHLILLHPCNLTLSHHPSCHCKENHSSHLNPKKVGQSRCLMRYGMRSCFFFFFGGDIFPLKDPRQSPSHLMNQLPLLLPYGHPPWAETSPQDWTMPPKARISYGSRGCEGLVLWTVSLER